MKMRTRRLLGGVVGLAVLLGVASTPAAQQTDAAFTDDESAAATFTALTVPAPVESRSPGCVASGGTLGLNPSVTIYWRIPAGVTGYSVADAQYVEATGGLLGQLLDPLLGGISTTGTASAYVTVISGGLLSGLLGGEKSFAIRLKGPGGWTSSWLVADAKIGLAGANPRCTIGVLPA